MVNLVSGINIYDDSLVFSKFSSKELGLAAQCKSFKLKLENIQIIALSPRLLLDDEYLFILIVDKNQQIYTIPAHVIGTKGLSDFEKSFNINSISDDWSKFEYNDYSGKVDKIIYPKERYWADLFSKDWKLMIREVYSSIIPKSFFGNITN